MVSNVRTPRNEGHGAALTSGLRDEFVAFPLLQSSVKPAQCVLLCEFGEKQMFALHSVQSPRWEFSRTDSGHFGASRNEFGQVSDECFVDRRCRESSRNVMLKSRTNRLNRNSQNSPGTVAGPTTIAREIHSVIRLKAMWATKSARADNWTRFRYSPNHIHAQVAGSSVFPRI